MRSTSRRRSLMLLHILHNLINQPRLGLQTYRLRAVSDIKLKNGEFCCDGFIASSWNIAIIVNDVELDSRNNARKGTIFENEKASRAFTKKRHPNADAG